MRTPHTQIFFTLATIALLLCAASFPAHAELFRAASLPPGGTGTMDIVLQELERRPASSVIAIKINKIGSSVGSSFFLLCSVRRLAQDRGNYRYIALKEDFPSRQQMLVAFLKSADADPVQADATLAGLVPPAKIIDLERFTQICELQKNSN